MSQPKLSPEDDSSFVSNLAKPIRKPTARAYAKYYQKKHPNSVRSVFFDSYLITKIVEAHKAGTISGLRLYLACYDEKKHGDDPDTPVDRTLWDKNNVIIAFTTKKKVGSLEKDVDGEYYNYSAPCPPSAGCEEDETLFKP